MNKIEYIWFIIKIKSKMDSITEQICKKKYAFKKGLSTLPLSIGYPLLATFSIVISTLMASFFLNESITNIKLLGTLLCILGIILISR